MMVETVDGTAGTQDVFALLQPQNLSCFGCVWPVDLKVTCYAIIDYSSDIKWSLIFVLGFLINGLINVCVSTIEVNSVTSYRFSISWNMVSLTASIRTDVGRQRVHLGSLRYCLIFNSIMPLLLTSKIIYEIIFFYLWTGAADFLFWESERCL